MKKMLFLLLTFSFNISMFAQTTWFVSPAGNNTTGNSWANAYHSIQDAVDAASANDDILVAYNPAGVTTYNLATSIDINNKPLRITSARVNQDNNYANAVYNSARCVLDGGNACRIFTIRGTSGSSTDDMIIRGFKMQNGNASNETEGGNTGGAVLGSGQFTLTNNRFFSNIASNTQGHGGAVEALNTGCLITSNLFYQNTATYNENYPGTGGAIEDAASGTITRNIFKENVCSPLWPEDALVENYGGAINASENCFISNNVFDGNYTSNATYSTTPRDKGEAIYAFNNTVSIQNNIFVNHNENYGANCVVDRKYGTPNLQVVNCLFYNNDCNNGQNTDLVNCIEGQDPLFTNAAGNDYTLQAGSPAIDAGETSSTPPEGGEPTIDMGAYEYIIENVVNNNCDMSWAGNFLEGNAFASISQAGNSSVQFQQVLIDPPNIPAGARHIGKYWDIQNVAGDSIKIRLYYTGAARADFTGVPTIYHYDTNDSEWKAVATNAEVAEGGAYYVETTNFHAGFSEVSVSDSDSPLPVELTSFSAIIINNGVELHWQTATEVNNYGFEIERASLPQNGAMPGQEDWETIGFVQGHGNSNSPKKYSFIDKLILESKQKLQYRLKQMDTDGSFTYSEVVEVEMSLSTKFEIFQNYPNPFNPSTTIRYAIPVIESMHGSYMHEINVTLKIYNLLGEEIATLVNEQQSPGKYKIDFDASNIGSGVYIYRIVAGDFMASKKLMIVK